jgi:glycosyltransferase involved in cell wall biosynthesis
MKISVVMTTYNGSKHIEEQLNSILNQTRQPDEVIICDDRSEDDTVNMVRQFITDYRLNNWNIFINNINLGWKKNFRKAIALASGDIIFFSDQDDIWIAEKIKIMSSLVEKYDMGCLYGESEKIDENGHPVVELNKVNAFTGALDKIQYSSSFYSAGGLGCCMCINRKIANKYLELNVEEDDHDSQCPRIALLYDTLWHIDMAVIKYRVYPGNTSGISNQYSFGTSNLKQRIADVEIIREWLKEVDKDKDVEELRRRDIIMMMKTLDKRIEYLKNDNVCFVSLIPYYKYFSGITMLLGDFSYKHDLNKEMGKVRWKYDKIKAMLKRHF